MTDLRPYTPVSRYGISPSPDTEAQIEVIREDGTAHLAIHVGGLWREAGRPTQTLDLMANRIAFWRVVP